MLRTHLRFGAGKCELYKNRTRIAMLSVEFGAYYWPDESESSTIAIELPSRRLFPNFIGLIDEALLPL